MGLYENREKLKSALEVQKELDRLKKGYKELTDGSISSPTLGDRVTGGVPTNEQQRLDNLLARIQEKEQDLKIEKEIVKRRIDPLDLSDFELEVITLRYFHCLTWREIAQELCYNIGHIKRVEKQALENVSV